MGEPKILIETAPSNSELRVNESLFEIYQEWQKNDRRDPK